MGDVSGDDEGAVEAEAGADGVGGEFGENLFHGAVEVDDGSVVGGGIEFDGCIASGVVFELFEEDSFGGNFGSDVTVGGAGDAEADGAASGVAGQANDAYVVAEIFASKLSSNTGGSTHFEDAFFPFEIAVGAAGGVALGGEVVEVADGGEFDGFHGGFGGGSANDKGEVIGGAGGGTDVKEFGADEFGELVFVEKGFGFLKEVGFIGGSSSFGDEGEVIFVAGGGGNIDLGGEVVAGVFFFEHGEGCYL